MRALALVTALLAAPAALAQPVTLPSLFDVTGISDTLNVRAGPDTSEPVVGRLPADARGVEVVALDPSGAWGLVNAGEQAGWVALRFLTEQPGIWAPGSLPAGLRCLGTEPFWSLTPGDGTLVFDTPENGAQSYPLTALDTGIPSDVRRALVSGEGGPTATISPRVCSDGMSDRTFGLETLVILAGEAGPRLLSGCCSIAPRN